LSFEAGKITHFKASFLRLAANYRTSISIPVMSSAAVNGSKMEGNHWLAWSLLPPCDLMGVA